MPPPGATTVPPTTAMHPQGPTALMAPMMIMIVMMAKIPCRRLCAPLASRLGPGRSGTCTDGGRGHRRVRGRPRGQRGGGGVRRGRLHQPRRRGGGGARRPPLYPSVRLALGSWGRGNPRPLFAELCWPPLCCLPRVPNPTCFNLMAGPKSAAQGGKVVQIQKKKERDIWGRFKANICLLVVGRGEPKMTKNRCVFCEV